MCASAIKRGPKKVKDNSYVVLFIYRVYEENGNFPTSVELAASLKIADGFIDKVKDDFILIMEGEMNYERDVRSKSNEQFTERFAAHGGDSGESGRSDAQRSNGIEGSGHEQVVNRGIGETDSTSLQGSRGSVERTNEARKPLKDLKARALDFVEGLNG